MKNTQRLTEGALFLAIFAIMLLITIYIPVLGVVVNLFLATPFIMFAAKYDRKSSIVFFIGAMLISLIVGTILAIPLALSYGLTGVVIGDFIREKKGRMASFLGGSIVFLISLVIQYAVAVAFFEVDFIKESIQLFEESVDQSMAILSSLGQSPDAAIIEQFEAGMKMLETLIPSLFVVTSFIIVFIIQLVSFPIVKRFGIDVSKWKPFRELTLPKSLLWYYLLVLLASLLFKPEEGSYWFSAIANISFILQLFMAVQGLSFIYYYSYEKNISKAIPVTITVLLFIMPMVLYIVRILGIIDLGFNLRERLGERK